MSASHEFYLSLGSNIRPEINLAVAILELQKHGQVEGRSRVWESRPVSSAGPNFLNICLLFLAGFEAEDLKSRILRPVETALGRVRGPNKDAPRTIDIDVLMVDGQPLNVELWKNAFVILPMAELLPQSMHPIFGVKLSQAAIEAQTATWIVPRPTALAQSRQ